MNEKEILQKVDHTLLTQTATWEEIRELCEDAMHYHTASVCIPPAYVKQAKAYVKDRMTICTVIGFPNGYNTTNIKKAEAEEAIQNGADEIDMVIHLGWIKDKKFAEIEEEIRILKEACKEKILKVIIETCLLEKEEKKKLCEIVTNAGADFIKTSTGFSTGGATLADIELFRENVGGQVQIKAAGGITSFADAQNMIEAGASRLGTSRLIKLLKGEA